MKKSRFLSQISVWMCCVVSGYVMWCYVMLCYVMMKAPGVHTSVQQVLLLWEG